MNTKYYLAFPKTDRIFNCLTGKFDAEVTVYEATGKLFDTQKEAEKFRKENIEEDIKGIGESVFEKSIICSVQEDLDTDGNGLNSYQLPRFSATKQVIFESYSF